MTTYTIIPADPREPGIVLAKGVLTYADACELLIYLRLAFPASEGYTVTMLWSVPK